MFEYKIKALNRSNTSNTSWAHNFTASNETATNGTNYTFPSPSPKFIPHEQNASNTTNVANHTSQNVTHVPTPSPFPAPSPVSSPSSEATNKTIRNITNSSYAAPTPSSSTVEEPSPSPSVFAVVPSPSSFNASLSNNTGVDPFKKVYEETIDWVIGGIIFAVIAFYCYVIFYPRRCSKVTKLIRKGGYNAGAQYGRVEPRVEDDVDNIELTVAFKEDRYTDDEKANPDASMERDLKESML